MRARHVLGDLDFAGAGDLRALRRLRRIAFCHISTAILGRRSAGAGNGKEGFMMTGIRGAMFAVATLAIAGLPAAAQNYPTHPITMIVPYPAGGPSDVVARIIADGMSKALGQNIVIENVGGAGGTIGTARVAAAKDDGYTLLAASMGSHVSAPALYPNLQYDSRKDFVPIGLTSHAPAAIIARKDFPAKNIQEFIAYLKENGEKVKQAHGGVGASSHMACLLFTSQLGLKPEPVP